MPVQQVWLICLDQLHQALMNNKSSTIPIMFHGGTYGTYLNWCLYTLTSETDIQAPFTDQGTSHNFKGAEYKSAHLLNMDGWDQYCSSTNFIDFVRFHPKTQKSDSLSDNLNRIMSVVNRAIYIYPDPNSVILAINNYYSKTKTDWWSYQFTNVIDPDNIYSNWPVPKNIPLDQIPQWVRREFLSLYLVPAWQDQVEWNHLDHWNHPNCCNVLVNDLLDNFESTIATVSNFCQIDLKRPIKDLLPFHHQNIKLQKFINQDRICNQIIQSIISGSNLDWEPLPLPSEAWLQWQLRNLGFEIQCHELDVFPTNSLQLKKLLFNI